ncbi:hypothetical protein MNBD_ALPHA06-2088 [hydrothermal vent metagenome]|uniref:M23ase beta-sheet core domain-containing protein n=1 Tax=hydrothermal vent metagenome TaxID=652676 RepID=A0A3B0RP07_9ZZZZ
MQCKTHWKQHTPSCAGSGNIFRQIALAVVLSSFATVAQAQISGGGGPVEMPRDDLSSVMPEIQQRTARNIKKLGLRRTDISGTASTIFTGDRSNFVPLSFPLRLTEQSENKVGHGTSNYVDLLDAGPGTIQEYTCAARSYDLANGYDHQGMDIFTWPFWWARMDAKDQQVIAAAAGTIVTKIDGRTDRNCSFTPADTTPNYIAVLQADGLSAYYMHMKKDSLTNKVVGDTIEVGEVLGYIGSSGISTAPHLHFELQDAQGRVVDPNAGACGASKTLWKHQPPYREPRVARVGVSLGAPNIPNDTCQVGVSKFVSTIPTGEVVSVGAYLVDQLVGMPATIALLRPDGSLYQQGVSGAPSAGQGDFNAAWWFFNFVMPLDAIGAWKARVTFDGKIHERTFWMNTPEPAKTALVASVLPTSRSVKAGTTATFFATALNFGAETAYGCSISSETPLAGRLSFQTTNPATNALTGTLNQTVDIAAGAGQSFLVAVDVEAGKTAKSLNVPLRVDCVNTDAAGAIDGVNSFLLSFEPNDVPDVIALSVTASNNGILSIAGAGAAGAFSLATANVGSTDTLTIAPRTTATGSIPMSICETNPSTAQCINGPSSSLSRVFAAGENATFAVFVTAVDAVPFDPAGSRIFVDIIDSEGVSRGSTSVAVRTDG